MNIYQSCWCDTSDHAFIEHGDIEIIQQCIPVSYYCTKIALQVLFTKSIIKNHMDRVDENRGCGSVVMMSYNHGNQY